MPTKSPYVQAVIDAYWAADAVTRSMTERAPDQLPIGEQRKIAAALAKEAREMFEVIDGPNLVRAVEFLQRHYERHIRREGMARELDLVEVIEPFPEPPKIRNVWVEDRRKHFSTNSRGQMVGRVTARYIDQDWVAVSGLDKGKDDAGWAWWEQDNVAVEVYSARYVWYTHFIERAPYLRAVIYATAARLKVTRPQLGLAE